MLNDRPLEPFIVQSNNDNPDHIQGIVPHRGSASQTDKKIGSSIWSERILLGLGGSLTLCCTLEVLDKSPESENMISIINN